MTTSVTTDVIAYLRTHPNVRIGVHSQRFSRFPIAAAPTRCGASDGTRPVLSPSAGFHLFRSCLGGGSTNVKTIAVGVGVLLMILLSGAVFLAPPLY